MQEKLKAQIKIGGGAFVALVAFAANSVLCRLALRENEIDAASFSAIRLLSGTLMFLMLLALNTNKTVKNAPSRSSSWISSCMLFSYATAFSYAYLSLDTGTGALILFGVVQLTMIFSSLYGGHRLYGVEWLGIAISFSGLVYLMLPSVSSPSVSGFILMSLSGIAWGGYTLKGRESQQPLFDSYVNFKNTTPLVILLVLWSLSSWGGGSLSVSSRGVTLALASGAIASALGYTLWYSVLKYLSRTEAAVIQLLVPVLAALGGVFVVSEPLSMRLVVASLLVLGGISIVVFGRKRFASSG